MKLLSREGVHFSLLSFRSSLEGGLLLFVLLVVSLSFIMRASKIKFSTLTLKSSDNFCCGIFCSTDSIVSTTLKPSIFILQTQNSVTYAVIISWVLKLKFFAHNWAVLGFLPRVFYRSNVCFNNTDTATDASPIGLNPVRWNLTGKMLFSLKTLSRKICNYFAE